MSHPRVHSPGKVAFSCEKKAGVSKGIRAHRVPPREQQLLPNLPPPPCSADGAKNSVRDFQIPLPPCAFQPPYYRTSSKKGLSWTQDDPDPFLTAYKECTKSRKSNGESILRKGMSIFSCKRSCTVGDNNLVRISHLPQNVHRV